MFLNAFSIGSSVIYNDWLISHTSVMTQYNREAFPGPCSLGDAFDSTISCLPVILVDLGSIPVGEKFFQS